MACSSIIKHGHLHFALKTSLKKCMFCAHDMDSTRSNVCGPCSSAFEEGTYCDKYHKQDIGWMSCTTCGRPIHLGCIMSFHAFDFNAAQRIICKDCVKIEYLMASNIGTSSAIPDPVNDSLLSNPGGSFEYSNVEQFMIDPRTAALFNNDPRNVGNAVIEGSLTSSQLPNSELIFLFEKKLSETDCRMKAGRLLLPRQYAEKFFPMLPDQNMKIPVVIKDTEGQTWTFNFRWWAHRKSRKYVMDGTRRCLRVMNWNAGDTLKFYRQLPENGIIMELVKAQDIPSTSSTMEDT